MQLHHQHSQDRETGKRTSVKRRIHYFSIDTKLVYWNFVRNLAAAQIRQSTWLKPSFPNLPTNTPNNTITPPSLTRPWNGQTNFHQTPHPLLLHRYRTRLLELLPRFWSLKPRPAIPLFFRSVKPRPAITLLPNTAAQIRRSTWRYWISPLNQPNTAAQIRRSTCVFKIEKIQTNDQETKTYVLSRVLLIADWVKIITRGEFLHYKKSKVLGNI